MTKEAKRSNLAQVKLALAKKYENLARLTRSKPRKKSLLNRMEQYVREARKAGQM